MRSALVIAGSEKMDYTRFILGDWSEYERSNVSQEDVKALIAVMKSVCKICPLARNAVVIRPDKTGNALVAFYKMLADDLPWKIEIFHDFDSAFAWLGMPIPKYLEGRSLVNTHGPYSNALTGSSAEANHKPA